MSIQICFLLELALVIHLFLGNCPLIWIYIIAGIWFFSEFSYNFYYYFSNIRGYVLSFIPYISFIHLLSERERENEKEFYLPSVLFLKCPQQTRLLPGWKQKPGIPQWSSMWIAGTKFFCHHILLHRIRICRRLH